MKCRVLWQRRDKAVESYSYETGQLNSAGWGETEYADVPIERPGDLKYAEVPGAINAIRSLETGRSFGSFHSERTFVKQAKLMEKYEDDYYYECNRPQLMPTFQSCKDIELRGYFGWRSAFRRDRFLKTGMTYPLLYTFELLNGIGARNPEDGYNKLLKLRRVYEDSVPDAFRMYDKWLTHYCVYYRLPESMLPDSAQREADMRMMCLIASEEFDDEHIGKVVFSNRHKEKLEHFFEDNKVKLEFENALGERKTMESHDFIGELFCMGGRAFRALKDNYSKHRKLSLSEDYFGSFAWKSTRLFPNAVFLNEGRLRNYDYEVDPICIYRCDGDKFRVKNFDTVHVGRERLSELADAVIYHAMKELGIPYEGPAGVKTGWMVKLIKEAVRETHKEFISSMVYRVDIDTSKLSRIRKEAGETAEKLLTEEERDFEISEILNVEEPEQSGISELSDEVVSGQGGESEEPEKASALSPLSDDEAELLRILVNGTDTAPLTDRGLVISVIADSINEKLYDVFNDIVIEMGDPFELIEDYREEITRMFCPGS